MRQALTITASLDKDAPLRTTSDTTSSGDYATRGGAGPGLRLGARFPRQTRGGETEGGKTEVVRPGANLQFPGVVMLVGGDAITVVVVDPVAPSSPDVVSVVVVDDAGRVVGVVVEVVVDVGTATALPARS